MGLSTRAVGETSHVHGRCDGHAGAPASDRRQIVAIAGRVAGSSLFSPEGFRRVNKWKLGWGWWWWWRDYGYRFRTGSQP